MTRFDDIDWVRFRSLNYQNSHLLAFTRLVIAYGPGVNMRFTRHFSHLCPDLQDSINRGCTLIFLCTLGLNLYRHFRLGGKSGGVAVFIASIAYDII